MDRKHATPVYNWGSGKCHSTVYLIFAGVLFVIRSIQFGKMYQSGLVNGTYASYMAMAVLYLPCWSCY